MQYDSESEENKLIPTIIFTASQPNNKAKEISKYRSLCDKV
jgi:hypothetical protein